jgi:hypothetical protein
VATVVIVETEPTEVIEVEETVVAGIATVVDEEMDEEMTIDGVTEIPTRTVDVEEEEVVVVVVVNSHSDNEVLHHHQKRRNLHQILPTLCQSWSGSAV